MVWYQYSPTRRVAEAFARHFQPVYNTSPVSYRSSLLSSDFLQLPAVSELDILKAIKRLGPYKPVGLNGMPGFIIKVCSTIFAPLLHVFSILASHVNTFQRSWKKTWYCTDRVSSCNIYVSNKIHIVLWLSFFMTLVSATCFGPQ